MARLRRKITFFGGAAACLLLAAVAIGIGQVAMGQEGDSASTPLMPGTTRAGTLVYRGAAVDVEYPEGWNQGVGDFGSFERYGVMLVSPAGTEVFINLNTKQIEISRQAPEDGQDVAFLLETGIRFKDEVGAQ